MSFWPKSRKARARLTIILAVAPVLAVAEVDVSSPTSLIDVLLVGVLTV